MFKRFTERARRVIILAREEAERHHHEYLGTEHILLGMLKDGGGIAITVLQKAGLSIDQIRMEVERHLPRNANALIDLSELGESLWAGAWSQHQPKRTADASSMACPNQGIDAVMVRGTT